MKSLLGFVFLLSLAAHAAAPKKDSVQTVLPAKKEVPQAQGLNAKVIMPQEQRGKELCWALMSGDSTIIASYFEDSVKANLDKEIIGHIQSQITWLSKLIGDSLDQLTTGTHRDSLGHPTLFYREYRLGNESNKRAPLLVIHILYRDSNAVLSSGAFVKSFLENSEKRLASEQTWKINGKNVDVNAVTVIHFQQGDMLAVKIYDNDTAALNLKIATQRGIPIVREALAQGYLEKAKAQLQGKTLLPGIGIAFIRKDPRLGFVELKYGIGPDDYKLKTDSTADSTQSAKPKAKSKSKGKKAAPPKTVQSAP